MRMRSADADETPAELCSAWTGRRPVPTLLSGTIQMCGVFLLVARSTSTALKITHFPSGEGTGSPTRFSFIMSSKVKGCLVWERAGRVRRRTTKIRRRMSDLQQTGECSTWDCRGQIAEVKQTQRTVILS